MDELKVAVGIAGGVESPDGESHRAAREAGVLHDEQRSEEEDLWRRVEGRQQRVACVGKPQERHAPIFFRAKCVQPLFAAGNQQLGAGSQPVDLSSAVSFSRVRFQASRQVGIMIKKQRQCSFQSFNLNQFLFIFFIFCFVNEDNSHRNNRRHKMVQRAKSEGAFQRRQDIFVAAVEGLP